jgi:hypothetical protein
MDIAWRRSRFDELGLHALDELPALRQRVFILEQGPVSDGCWWPKESAAARTWKTTFPTCRC